MPTPTFSAEPGSAHSLGTTTDADGVNFSLFSEAATFARVKRYAELAFMDDLE